MAYEFHEGMMVRCSSSHLADYPRSTDPLYLVLAVEPGWLLVENCATQKIKWTPIQYAMPASTPNIFDESIETMMEDLL